MFKHLAVAIDFSDISDPLLAQLDEFRQLGAERLTLIHVQEIGYPISAAGGDDYYREKLNSVAAELEEEGWEVQPRHVQGRPSNRIVDVAGEVDADLIVVGNKGHGAVAEVLLGSVATEVLERSSRPVFLYGHDDEVERPIVGDTLVLPTDFSEAADEALSVVAAVAVDRKLPVVVFHFIDAADRGSDKIEQQRREQLEQRRRRLEEAGVEDITIELDSSRPRKAVIARVEDHPGALCVMGTDGHGRFGDPLLGGVTRRMARRGSHHMLVVSGQST